jgi:hypothetical protein
MKRLNACMLVACLAVATLADHSDGQRGGRGGGGRGGGGRGGGGSRGGGGFGGGGMSRGGARTSVTFPSSRPSGGFSRPSAPAAPSFGQPGGNRPAVGSGGNVANRPGGGANIGNGDRTYVNNRPINVRDNDIVAGGGRWDNDYGCCSGRGAAFAAGAITAAAIGSVMYTLPPSCPITYVGSVTYNYCGGVWYQPQFSGTDTTYIVVEAPSGGATQGSTPPPDD